MSKVTIQTAIDEEVWLETKKAARETETPLRAYITEALKEHLDRQRLTPATRRMRRMVKPKGIEEEWEVG